ncbi:hypothetical protein EMIHUDRAFT_463627 [Emiliania huxleyi CCMP1516]|uniref:FHA domain-containing protein n=2 Tax=Emiliania huxleyi TaxID=2903 RepID=A0A0D3JKK2_EMIH1|nr:hypothetical protein EMIHUDRAFT_463627 [Emiliania huxleyi CCMP1516]EOD24037.1 hypothetical protein EMIHUDRAFT_463627 [Emiliania huxleyi CCMP1516]|eukprot:XP_005776466.1 hypothetical protein EMIHUDRAFT_463627 [Emiliania huxleyi CCMP1516]
MDPLERHTLTVYLPGKESVHSLRCDASLTVGRRPSSGIVLEDARVSADHLRFTANHELYITDSSSNGTFHNGKRLPKGEPRALQPGDLISLIMPVKRPPPELSEEKRAALVCAFRYTAAVAEEDGPAPAPAAPPAAAAAMQAPPAASPAAAAAVPVPAPEARTPAAAGPKPAEAASEWRPKKRDEPKRKESALVSAGRLAGGKEAGGRAKGAAAPREPAAAKAGAAEGQSAASLPARRPPLPPSRPPNHGSAADDVAAEKPDADDEFGFDEEEVRRGSSGACTSTTLADVFSFMRG